MRLMIRINAPESQRTLRNHKERFGITKDDETAVSSSFVLLDAEANTLVRRL